ncbi:MAG: anion permease [Treponema sp.]|nr:anion permease [Treponema sp.]
MSPVIIAAIIMVATFVLFFHPKIENIIVGVGASLAFGLTGIVPINTLFNFYTSNTCMVMIGMMTIGGAMFQSGLAGWIGAKVIKVTGTNEVKVQFAILLVSALLATSMNGSSVLMIMYPLMCSVAISSKISMSRTVGFYMSGSLMGSYLTLSGGMVIISAALLESAGYRMWNFFEVSWYGIPRLLLALPAVYFLGRRVLPKTMVMPDVPAAEKKEGDLPDKFTVKMGIVLAILLLTIAGMVTNFLKVPLSVYAVLGGLACLITNCITPKQMFSAISWNTIVLIGSMTAVAKGVELSGIGTLIGQSILGFTGAGASPVLLVFIILMVTAVITQFMSDSGTIALMTPIAISIAIAQGIEPYAYAMAVLVGSAMCHLSIMASPSLAFIMNMGGYKPSFFPKWGLVVEFLPSLIAAMIMIPLIWL